MLEKDIIIIILILTVIFLARKGKNTTDRLEEKRYYKYVKREIDFPKQRIYKKIIYWTNYIKGTTEETLDKLKYRFIYKKEKIEKISDISIMVTLAITTMTFILPFAYNITIRNYENRIEEGKYYFEFNKDKEVFNKEFKEFLNKEVNNSIQNSYNQINNYTISVGSILMIIYLIILIIMVPLLFIYYLILKANHSYYITLISIIDDEIERRKNDKK